MSRNHAGFAQEAQKETERDPKRYRDAYICIYVYYVSIGKGVALRV